MTPDHFTKADLEACGQGTLFPGKMRLPINEMLMMDRVTHFSETDGLYGKGRFFKVHFVDDPVMPGCLGLDAMWQLVGFFLAATGGEGKGRALGSGEVKFSGQVLPTNKLVRYHLDIKRVIRRKLTMAIADARMEVDGREIYTAKDLKVGMFNSTDDF